MPTFSAAEIAEAYAAMHARVEQYSSGDWRDVALNFTEDATYVEHAFGTFRGRAAIGDWAVQTMTSLPGSVMTGFPIAWQSVDARWAKVVEAHDNLSDQGRAYVAQFGG